MVGLVYRALTYYWRAHFGVLMGTALAAAVLTGALLVGDSVDYSLRSIATQRLGGVRFAVENHGVYFHDELASRLARRVEAPVSAVLRLPGIAIVQGDRADEHAQANQVQVVGVDADFWNFADGVTLDLGEHETAINTKLAVELGVKAGDTIALRVFKPAVIARDAPLSQRGKELFQRSQFTVKRVLSDDELGRFSLSPSQVPPYNAFVGRAWLQNLASVGAQANMLLVGEGVTGKDLETGLKTAWEPEDVGLHFTAHPGGVVQLETERIFFDPESARTALALPGAQGTLTYLVNSIRHQEKMTPYSFVVAGPVPEGMGDDEIVINEWLSDQIHARVGDKVEMAYYELLPSNQFVERTRFFTVHSIRAMEDLTAEKELMPHFPGLSDVERCVDWDVGMPMDESLLKDEANEAYWETYRQTPKAFVTLRAGQQMWANRFGDLTAVRYPGDSTRVGALRDAFAGEANPAGTGLFFRPVHQQAIDAVNEALDFGGLFLGLSFFLIVAALILTGLLHVFGIQQRLKEIGTLLALGFRHGQVRTLFMAESLATALAGAALGAFLGLFYSHALISGLARYWEGAVAGTAIEYHGSPQTLFLGAGISFVCAMLTMALTLWRQSRHSARELLHADLAQEWTPGQKPRPRPVVTVLAWSGLAASVAIALYASLAPNVDPSEAFFAAGSLLLLSCLGLFRRFLASFAGDDAGQRLSLWGLALKNLSRRPGRSLTVVGLLASGCFLVFSVSSMQEDLQGHAGERSSGTGGFAVFADSTFPLLENPAAALGDPDVSGTALRLRDGDDASCLNLNKAQSPRLLGVNVNEMLDRNAFTGDAGPDSVWRLLKMKLDDGSIPALVGDTDTAMWTLKKSVGVENGDTIAYRDEFGNDVKVRLVGTLPMRLSVFQGTVLIDDAVFTRLYPSEEGYRMFLIDAPEAKASDVVPRLRKKYERFGFEAVPAVERLEDFYTVERTYLAMFLVLGGLGLAVGSLGMGIVVLRNLLERRSEVAILRALGFGAGSVYRLLAIEYGALLVAGLGIGGVAAAVSILPAFLAAQSHVDLGSQAGLLATILLASGTCMILAIVGGVEKNDPGALRNE